jgi:hypothetical protein
MRYGDIYRQSGHNPQWETCEWVAEMKNPPASQFEIHTAQEKGGWTCPAAELIRRTQKCDAHGRQSLKLLLLLRFLFRRLLCFLRHGMAPVLTD